MDKNQIITFKKSQSKKSILIDQTKKTIKKYEDEIEDIILFGSFMKGKNKPNDIDVLIVFKQKVNKKIESEFKQINLSNLDLNSTTLKELENNSFIAKEGLYLEGLSLKDNKTLSSKLGFKSVAFVKYSLENIHGSNRVRFYYALNGRKGELGFIHSIDAKRYSENIIVCNYNQIETLKDFFKTWQMEIQVTPSLIPERLYPILINNEK